MCGRYSIILTAEEIAEIFGLARPSFSTSPRYNLAPTQEAPIIVASAQNPNGQLLRARFGLIPFWAKDTAIAAKLINARAETVAQKPSFRRAFAVGRCLVVADGFYEWQGSGARKQPYRIITPDSRPFAFAGVRESWCAADGKTVDSFAIITTEPNDTVRPIHDRMPVILREQAAMNLWLKASDTSEVQHLLRPYAGGLEAYRVSSMVNSVTNDVPECILPAPGQASYLDGSL